MSLIKQQKLVDLLLERTRKSKLEWQTTLADNAFQISFRDNSVRLEQVETGGNEPDYVVSLINSEGNVVENFSDVDLWQDQKDLSESDRKNYYRALAELYALARRTALGSDKVLNSILNELDDEIPF